MGKKKNTKNIRSSALIKPNFNSLQHSTEFSVILKENLSICSSLSSLFDKKKYLVKETFFKINQEKSLITFFISFFSLKQKRLKFSKKKESSAIVLSDFGAYKISQTFNKFGYFSSKRLIFRNLNNISLKNQKTIFKKETSFLKNTLKAFQKESFFLSGISLCCLLSTSKGNSVLLSKYIAKFLKIFHKNRQKSNKFKFFLSQLVQTVINPKFPNIKGLKIKINGRFHRVDKANSLLFERGSLPLQTFTSDIEYSITHVATTFGIFGIHVWVFN